MTASSSARAMRAPGSGGAVIVAVVSPSLLFGQTGRLDRAGRAAHW